MGGSCREKCRPPSHEVEMEKGHLGVPGCNHGPAGSRCAGRSQFFAPDVMSDAFRAAAPSRAGGWTLAWEKPQVAAGRGSCVMHVALEIRVGEQPNGRILEETAP